MGKRALMSSHYKHLTGRKMDESRFEIPSSGMRPSTTGSSFSDMVNSEWSSSEGLRGVFSILVITVAWLMFQRLALRLRA